MKRSPFIVIATTLLFAAPSTAQNWCPPGATWVYHTPGDPSIFLGGGARYRYEGDTLLDGYTAQRISVFTQSTIQLPWEDTATVYQSWQEDEVTRTETGMVYIWLRDLAEWDTLYWFSAEVGDRWNPGWHQYYYESCEPTGYLEVVNVATGWDIGVPVRKLTLAQYYNGEEYQNSITIAERIGNMAGCWIPRPPGWWCGTFQESGCEFRCYSDQDAFYTPWPDFIESCAYPSTVEQYPPPAGVVSWAVYPVPFSDRFTVRSVSSPTTHLVLMDFSGRELLRESFYGTAGQVETGLLAPGSYVLRFTDGHGNQMHRAVIKE